jgi:hypothetical protein
MLASVDSDIDGGYLPVVKESLFLTSQETEWVNVKI